MPTRPKVRLFVESGLAAGARVALAPAQVHYLAHVMRLGPDDRVALFNGRDGEWSARLDSVSKGQGAAVAEALRRPQRSSPDVWLAFAPLKKAATDVMVEKATELGVARLILMVTRRTTAARVNVARLKANAIEAAEQCERLTVPDIAEPVTFERLITEWPAERTMFVLDETGAGRPIADTLAEWSQAEGRFVTPCHGFLAGPEGGFDGRELDALAKLPFAVRLGLGPRILRAETAALAALACWQALVGDGGDRPPARTGS